MATSPHYCLKRPDIPVKIDRIREDLETAIDNKLSKRWNPGDEITVDLDASHLTVDQTKAIFDYFRTKYSLIGWEGITYFGLRNNAFTSADHIMTFRLVFPNPLKNQ